MNLVERLTQSLTWVEPTAAESEASYDDNWGTRDVLYGMLGGVKVFEIVENKGTRIRKSMMALPVDNEDEDEDDDVPSVAPPPERERVEDADRFYVRTKDLPVFKFIDNTSSIEDGKMKAAAWLPTLLEIVNLVTEATNTKLVEQ